MNRLPNEILARIFFYSSPRQLIKQSIVSKRWHDLTKVPSVWKKSGYKNYNDYKQSVVESLVERQKVKVKLVANAPNTIKSEILKFHGLDADNSNPKISLDFKMVVWGRFLLTIWDTTTEQRFVRILEKEVSDANVLLLCVENLQQLQNLLVLCNSHANVNSSIYVVTSETCQETRTMQDYLINTNNPIMDQVSEEIIVYRPKESGVKDLFTRITAKLESSVASELQYKHEPEQPVSTFRT
ncbi:MAG: F-box protein [Gammaproteobacteria bacterium]